MLKSKWIFLGILLLSFNLQLLAQKQFGFDLPKNRKSVRIPFELYNNLIIIPVIINNFFSTKFILDTGVNTPIFTEEVYARAVGINYLRDIYISGPGMIDSIYCILGNGINIDLSQDVIGKNLNLLVLKEDYLKLSEKIGDDVLGIIGYDIFNRFVVEINYYRSYITLHDAKKYVPKSRYAEIPLQITHSKPYIETIVKNVNQKDTATLLIDTGASHAVILDLEQIDITPPKKVIVSRLGTGLGGEIPGRVGRIDSLKINTFQFSDVLISMPDPNTYNQVIKRGSRQGTIGGELLKRFNPIFDYSRKKLYLVKNNNFHTLFEYDMSGITLVAKGEKLDKMIIEDIRKESPADKIGLSKGDTLKSINGLNLLNSNLSEIYHVLRTKQRKKIIVKVLKNGKVDKLYFRLEKSI